MKGRKPTPGHLRLITGTHRDDRHGETKKVQETAAAAVAAFGPLTMPNYLRGHAREAWIRFIKPADWLDGSRHAAAVAMCELYGEMRSAPSRFPASRHSQLRAYLSLLGLSDLRNRPIRKPTAAPDDEFFND